MIDATDITILGDPRMPTLLQGPGMPTLLGSSALPTLLGGVQLLCPQDGGPCVIQRVASENKAGVAAMIVGALLIGTALSAVHGAWAYGDWTCAFKSCVAVAPVRRRRKGS